MRIFRKAYWKYNNPIRGAWYSLRYGIENLFIYAPVIWRDRDWDWTFFADLMEFKLRRMANHLERHEHHTNKERDIEEMRECAAILFRLRNETWEETALAAHEAKWGELLTKNVPHENGLTQMLFSRPNAITDEQIAQERKEAHAMYDDIEAKVQADLKRLGELLMNMRNWWD